MPRTMTSQLLRTTAISLMPIALMAPAAAFAEGDASDAAIYTTVASAAQDDFSFDASEEVAEPKPVYVNEIEIGAGWVSEDSAEFGEFSGLQTEGAFLIGNVNVQMRNPYDGDNTQYFIVRGTDLGIESRTVYAEYGRQGKFSIFGLFDSAPKYLHDDARSPYIFNDGGTLLTLPAGWVTSDRDISMLTELNSSLQDVNVSHQREKAGGGISWLPGKDWSVETSFFRETKQGTRTIAAIFGTSGGNPAGAIVPEPVDYQTDNFNASLNYAGKKAQFALSYNLSVFRDNIDALTFQNPFNSAAWAAVAGYPDGFGSLALPPDNQAHSFSFAGRYLLTKRTSATAHINYSRMTQDDLFQPLTVNPGLAVTIPLPRNSLDGEINTLTANLGISTRVSPKFSYRASYRYENRDNNTPRELFQILRADSEDQPTDLTSSRARFTLPYSRKQQEVVVEADYRLAGNSKITIAYEYEQLKRDYTEVEKTKEHRVKGKFSISPSMRSTGWVGVEYSSRTGTEYVHNLPFMSSRTPERLGPDPTSKFENHPLIRKFYIADRDRVKVNGAFNWLPVDDLNFGVMANYNRDEYDESVLGLTRSTMASVTGDLSYQPSERVGYHLFYTYDDVDHEQSGISHASFTAPEDLFNQALIGWSVDTQDRIHTAGAGMDWDVVKDKFNLSVDYYFSHASTDFVYDGGADLTFGPAPDLETRLNSIETVAEYQVSDQMWFKIRYMFSKYSVTDFALDGVDPDTMSTIIGLGNQSPNFDVHVVGFSGVYRF